MLVFQLLITTTASAEMYSALQILYFLPFKIVKRFALKFYHRIPFFFFTTFLFLFIFFTQDITINDSLAKVTGSAIKEVKELISADNDTSLSLSPVARSSFNSIEVSISIDLNLPVSFSAN